MEPIGCSAYENRTRATPPSVTNAGSPSTVASARRDREMDRKRWDGPEDKADTATMTAVSTVTNALVRHDPELRSKIRSAIRMKPAGMAASIHQMRTDPTRKLPTSRSIATNCHEATARNAVTAAATELVKTRELARNLPGSQVCSMLERANSLPSRAAIRAPIIPTRRTACCTSEVEAGMPA